MEGTGTRVRGALSAGDNPVIVDDVLTPVATRALRDLDEMPSLRITPDNIAADLRGVEQARKRLVRFYAAARGVGKAEDVRAMDRVIHEFDNHIESAISNGLFSGDPRALDAIRAARAQYARYAREFRPQGAGDDVGNAMRRIIDRNATPEEIGNMVVGSGAVGRAGLPVRLAERLEQVLGRDSDAFNAIRQAVWNRVSVAANPARTSQGILEFTQSSLARRLYSQPEIAVMRGHATAVRDLEQTIARLPSGAAAERARTGYQTLFGGEGIGGTQGTLFRKIADGSATNEEVVNSVFSAANSSSSGNVVRMLDAIERISGPQTMAAIRQGVWQKLMEGGAQKRVSEIADFLNGNGRTVARKLYSPEELAMMQRYSDAIGHTVIPKAAKVGPDTAPAMASIARHSAGAVTDMLITHAAHWVPGGHYLVSGGRWLLGRRMETKADNALLERVRKQINWSRGGAVKRARGGRLFHPVQTGAKRAKDGQWYKEDLDRPGQWLHVRRRDTA
jgi:hypothetical protein